MAWDYDDFFRSLGDQLDGFYQTMSGDGASSSGAAGSMDLSTLLEPVEPFNRSSLFTPVVRFAGVTALVVFSGVAVGSFFVTLLALMAILFLLSRVFGYELELAPFPNSPFEQP